MARTMTRVRRALAVGVVAALTAVAPQATASADPPRRLLPRLEATPHEGAIYCSLTVTPGSTPRPSIEGWVGVDGAGGDLRSWQVAIEQRLPGATEYTTLTTVTSTWGLFAAPLPSTPLAHYRARALGVDRPQISADDVPLDLCDVRWDPSVYRGDLLGDGSSPVLAVRQDGALTADYSFANAKTQVTLMPRLGRTATWIGSPGDITRDGLHDLLTRRADGSLWLYPGRGRGLLGTPRRIGTGFAAMTALVAPGDVTGDGRPDLLARTPRGVLVSYRLPGATGSVVRERTFGGGWNAMRYLVPAGNQARVGADVFGIDASGVMYEFVLADHATVRRTRVGAGWTGFTSIAAPGDFSGDGFVDLVSVTPTGHVRIHPFAGQWRDLSPEVLQLITKGIPTGPIRYRRVY